MLAAGGRAGRDRPRRTCSDDTPRPFLFFGWIVALVTTLVVVYPFSTTAPLGAKIATAAVFLAIGAMTGTLVGGGSRPVD